MEEVRREWRLTLAKEGIDFESTAPPPTLSELFSRIEKKINQQGIEIFKSIDGYHYSKPDDFPAGGYIFWFGVKTGESGNITVDRIANAYDSTMNEQYCCLHLDDRTSTLQPLLLADFSNIPKFPGPGAAIKWKRAALRQTPAQGRVENVKNRATPFFFLNNAPIYWVDEEQYLYPPLYEPKPAEQKEYYDAKKILKPEFTRIYYWHIPSPPSPPSLESFYVNYALTQRTGGGSLAMRVDPLSEVEWTCNVGSSTTGKATEFANQRAKSIGLAPSDVAQVGYFQTNTPTPPLNAVSSIDAKEPYAQYGGIVYYKRFKVNPGGTPLPRKNKPADPGPPRIPDEKSLDISRLYRKKVKRKKLTKSAGARADAGTVMAGEILKQMGKENYPFDRSKLSATTYVQHMLSEVGEKPVDEKFRESWKTHTARGTQLLRAPDQTSQEWCHLHGHGDGGPEVYENFVAGSKHCNTEQLAIELGQRIAGPGDLTARVTAYLFESHGHGDLGGITADVLKAAINQRGAETQLTEDATTRVDRIFSPQTNGVSSAPSAPSADMDGDTDPTRATSELAAIAETRAPASQAGGGQRRNVKRQRDKQSTTDQNPQPANKARIDFIERIEQEIKAFLSSNPDSRAACNLVIAALQSLYVPLPIARWMRYKIYHEEVKIFEHVYDGQSESFDANEGNILKLAVEHAVAHKLGGEILKQYNARLDAQIAAHARASAAAAPGGAASSSSEPGHDDDVVMQEPSDPSESAGTGKSRRRKRNE